MKRARGECLSCAFDVSVRSPDDGPTAPLADAGDEDARRMGRALLNADEAGPLCPLRAVGEGCVGGRPEARGDVCRRS